MVNCGKIGLLDFSYQYIFKTWVFCMFSFLDKLKKGLEKSASKLGGGLAGLFTGKRKLDQALLDQLEELLIEADLGPKLANRLVKELADAKFDKQIEVEEVKAQFANSLAKTLGEVAAPLPAKLSKAGEPTIILVVGVNGSGKTTTIGKLSHALGQENHSVMLAAGDTYRAAAVEQLEIWGKRNEIPVITAKAGMDAAALAFDAIDAAQKANKDYLIMDTAGRLHNRNDLMQELVKIKRVMAKKQAGAPHHIILVLDATIGQNALVQLQAFMDMTELTGLVVTKLDGTAKGGVLVALAEQFKLPVHAIGIGEGIEDLRPFNPQEFANSLLLSA